VRRYNHKNQKLKSYPDHIPLFIRPRGPNAPITLPPTELPPSLQSLQIWIIPKFKAPIVNISYLSFHSPQPFSQVALNDLVRDLVLSKEAAALLGSRLKEKEKYWPNEPIFVDTGKEENILLNTLWKTRTWSLC
ncbi:hypothetical protein NPIL_153021, partial [Nephila pilipes]